MVKKEEFKDWSNLSSFGKERLIPFNDDLWGQASQIGGL
jgi:hypothetical protein